MAEMRWVNSFDQNYVLEGCIILEMRETRTNMHKFTLGKGVEAYELTHNGVLIRDITPFILGKL